ncbi:MAG: hypothetical protein KAH22_05600 [Thiotrichaceae bacterium]|nr:hypothetical protein [Thiotrichaceae bacterium]
MASLQSIIDNNTVIYFGNTHHNTLYDDPDLCQEIQTILSLLGYYLYTIDGNFGLITKTALQDFIESENFSHDYLLTPTVAEFLLLRIHLGEKAIPSSFDQDKPSFQQSVIKTCLKQGLPLKTQMAYILATTEHETNATYQPVKEAYWLSDAYRKKHFKYYPYYGRGYVQLTHDYNYKKYSKLLGIDLLNNPDKVMDPSLSLFILVHGMATGLFTGKRLGLYINANQTDYVNARRVVNGRDKQHHIAKLAKRWHQRLLSEEENLLIDDNFSFSLDQESETNDLITQQFKRQF